MPLNGITMGRVTVPNDPNAHLKQYFEYYLRSKSRHGANIALTEPLTAEEDQLWSMTLCSEKERKALHAQHQMYLKLMRLSGQLQPKKKYPWPPKRKCAT